MPKAKKEEKPKKKIVAPKAAPKKKPAAKKPAPAVKEAPKKVAPPPAPAAVVQEKHIEVKKPEARKFVKKEHTFFHGVGGRKTANARVYLTPGQGKILINGRPYEQYVTNRELLKKMVVSPLLIANVRNRFDVNANVHGGGIPSQAQAVGHGIARALLQVSPDFRAGLKKAGELSRDSRMKERKKYGRKRARKRFQYSKR